MSMTVPMRGLFCAVLCAAVAGCGSHEGLSEAGARKRETRIDLLGHECFLLTSSFGLKILTNPYGAGTGEGSLPSSLRPDVLLVSTERSDCNNVDAAENSPDILRGAVALGANTSSGIRIRGVPSYENPEKAEDMNVIFAWTLDGVRCCFAGNVQGPLPPYELAQIGTVDVLFLPVGLPATLTDAERSEIISQLRPRLIIPMGRAAAISAWALPPAKTYRLPGASVLVTRETLPAEPTVLLFAQ